MKSKIRYCELCDKKIKCVLEIVGRIGGYSLNHLVSEEGVLYREGRVWFCNKCWEKVFPKID